MSVKILTGFVFEGVRNLKELHITMRNLRKEIQTTKNQLVSKLIGQKVANQSDQITLGRPHAQEFKNKEGLISWLKVADYVEKKLKEIPLKPTKSLEDFYDMTFEVVIFPYGKKIYGIYYTEIDEFEQILTTKPYFRDFHYQNSGDRPKDISAREWAYRLKVWNNILLKNYNSSAEAGITITLADIDDRINWPWKSEDQKEFIPSFNERVQSITTDMFFVRMVDLIKNNATSEIRDTDIYIDVMWNLAKFKKEYSNVYQEIEQDVTKKLPMEVEYSLF